MAGLDKDLAKLGDKVGKSLAKKFGKDFARSFGPNVMPGVPGVPSVPGVPHDPDDADDDDDDDDKDAVTVSPSISIDMDSSDMGPAIAALKGLSLSADQRKQLAQLRADTDSQVQRAKAELDDLSNRLHRTLGDAGASEADIARQIDSISAKEAAIRKVRILAWVKARNLLKKDQRKQVEAAVKSH
jgi:Spy/CpxP family protein refolding chaperone